MPYTYSSTKKLFFREKLIHFQYLSRVILNQLFNHRTKTKKILLFWQNLLVNYFLFSSLVPVSC